MKPAARPRGGGLGELLALGLLTGAVLAWGGRLASESARLETRIRLLESRQLSDREASLPPPREGGQPGARRPDAERVYPGYTTERRLLKLLDQGGIEVTAYTLEPEKGRLILSGSTEPEELIAFFIGLENELPGTGFDEFEISRSSGGQRLHFGFSFAPRSTGKSAGTLSRPAEDERRVLRLLTPPPLRPPPSGRQVAARTMSPVKTPPVLQPAKPPPAGRYIGSAVVNGTLRLYLMDEVKRHLTVVTPDTEDTGPVTGRLETGTVEETKDENQSIRTDEPPPAPYPVDPFTAASGGLRQPRP